MNSEAGFIALGVLGNFMRFFGGDTNEESYTHVLVGRVTLLLSKSTIIALGEARIFEGCPPIYALLNHLFNNFAAAFRAPTRSFISLSRTQLYSQTSLSSKSDARYNDRVKRSHSQSLFWYSPCERGDWGKRS